MSLCLPDLYFCCTKYRLPLQLKITKASLLCEDVDEFLRNPLNVHENETNNLSCLDKTIFYFEYIRTHSRNIRQMQGLFVPFARVGSGDTVRVLRLFHNKYTGYN